MSTATGNTKLTGSNGQPMNTHLSAEEIREDAFMLYLKSGAMDSTTYMGVKTLKIPFDLWNYQEILYQNAPDVIIETGTFLGGSALYLAHVCDQMKKGRVISLDVVKRSFPVHERITYLNKSSIDVDTVNHVKTLIKPNETVMVILDADHAEDFVDKELEVWAPLVSTGQYLIVEDTALFDSRDNTGPLGSVRKFLKANIEYVVDTNRHKFGMTMNPNGYLYKQHKDNRNFKAGL